MLPPDDPSDLIRQCIGGNQHAWAALIDRYAGLVYAIARAHRLDESDCDDVAQAVFAALVRRLDRIERPEALPGWLSVSARRESWRVARRVRARGPSAHPEPVFLQPDEVEDLERRFALRDAFERLDARCRDLLNALFAPNAPTSYHDVSARLGIPVGSIGPTRLRCLDRLAGLMNARPDPPA